MMILGKTAKIVDSTNKEQIGLQGIIIEDGKDSLRIRTSDGREKLLIKSTLTLEINRSIHEGKDLVGTHANRLKR